MLEHLLECARRWGWRHEGASVDDLLEAWRSGARIGIFQDAGRADWRRPTDELPTSFVPLLEMAQQTDVDFLVVISDCLWPGNEAIPTLLLRPRTLTLGLSGPDTGEIAALEQAARYYCEHHGLAITSLTALATIQDDPGQALFAEWADRRELPLLVYAPARLEIVPFPSRTQPGHQGFWPVEAAAMLAAGSRQVVASASLIGDWEMAMARRQTG